MAGEGEVVEELKRARMLTQSKLVSGTNNGDFLVITTNLNTVCVNIKTTQHVHCIEQLPKMGF